MKAELDENGTLTVSAETPTEAYALKNWNEKRDELRVSWEMPKKLTPLTDVA